MKIRLIALSLVLGFVLISAASMAQCIYQLDDYTVGPQPYFYAGENRTSVFITTYENGNGANTHTWTAPSYGTIVDETVNVINNMTRAWITVEWDNFPSGIKSIYVDNISVQVTGNGAGCPDTKSHYVVVIGQNHPVYPLWF